MAESNGKVEIDFTNVELAKFSIHIITLLANSVRKTCCKLRIDNFTKSSNNKLITSLIMNIRAESATYMEEYFTIFYCQVNKLDCFDIGNINHVGEDVILLWQEIICHDGQQIEVDTDMDNN